MSTFRNTDEILEALSAINTYYIKEDDGSHDLVELETKINVKAVRRNTKWKFVAKFKARGDGGIEWIEESNEHNSPDEAVKELGDLIDDRGCIHGIVNKGHYSETSAFIGPYLKELDLET